MHATARRSPLSLLLAVALGACAGVPLPREQLTDPAALLFNGYVKKDVDCYVCHNGDGSGARGPSLVNRVRRMDLAEVREVITDGEGFMPRYRSKLTDDEVDSLARWLKATFP